MIAGILAEIRTKDLSSTSIVSHRYTSFLHVVMIMLCQWYEAVGLVRVAQGY
jgi:hypothetical protein